MNFPGLTDSLAGLSHAPPACARCGSVAQLAGGLCLACSLRPALEGEGSDAGRFAAALAAIEVREADWRLDHYQILEKIGHGGMGVIYRARQRHSRRTVALKRILSHHADSQETLERFRREAEAAASLDHPHILPIYEVGEAEDRLPFFSMKYAAGGSLQEAKAALRGEPRRCVELMAKVARAVQHAHEHGILHRDLKPGNILLDGGGEPLVSDFGLAKWLDATSDLTRSLAVYGTPGYIAPEQASGSRTQLTPAADVYSLGAILFDLLAGRPPFLGENALAVLHEEAEKPAPKLRTLVPTLDRELETICAKCLARAPEARYRSAAALAEDLERWLEGRPIAARPIHLPEQGWRWAKRNPTLALATASAITFAVISLALFLAPGRPSLLNSPPKSIAVLPFENIGDEANRHFALGIQDEILTYLAGLSDLRVISRTSVAQYPPGPHRNARTIAGSLGVRYLLEGSVQQAEGNVRVHAKLIDARNDAQIWAHNYGGPLSDIFEIQSEIAKAIVSQLRIEISSAEDRALERKPTSNLAAFDLYTRGKNFVDSALNSDAPKEMLLQGIDLLAGAVARDPAFISAYYDLARGHDVLYITGFDHTPGRLSLAQAAVESATRLAPTAPETRLARAFHLYARADYSGARKEAEAASKALPNNPRAYELRGYIDRRVGRWEESAANFEKALQLDPSNVLTLQQAAQTFQAIRHHEAEARILDRILVLRPGDLDARVSRAQVEVFWHADLHPLKNLVSARIAADPSAKDQLVQTRLFLAFLERDVAAIQEGLDRLGAATFGGTAVRLRRAFGEGLLARMQGDAGKAQAAFAAERALQAPIVAAQPDYALGVSLLGMIDAGLGRKDEALSEGRRAVELLPVEKDSLNGPLMVWNLAMIAAWVGEADLALRHLGVAAQLPGGPTYGELKLSPIWDPLRGHEGFTQIVKSLAPK